MKKILSVFSVFCVLIQYSFCQPVQTNGRLSNAIYVFENQGNKTSDRVTRLYQTLRSTAQFNTLAHIRINLAGRVLTQFGGNTLSDEYRYHMYRMSVSGLNLFHNTFDFEIGRQFLNPGLVLGSLDGANLIYKPSTNLKVQFYAGVESHLLRAAYIYKPKDAAIFGGSVRYANLLNTNMQLVYLHKQNSGKANWQIAGINLVNHSFQNLSFIFQTQYDFINSRLHRLYVSSTYHFKQLSANLYFKQQQPQVYGDSYFQIFDVEKYQVLGVNLGYALNKKFTLNGMMQGVQLEEGFGNRYMVSLNDQNGSAGIIYETGDLGEQFALMLDYGYEIIPDLIASFYIDYSRYRFEKIYVFDKQLANALRLNYRLNNNWRFDLEYQWLSNKQMASDQRILNQIHFIW